MDFLQQLLPDLGWRTGIVVWLAHNWNIWAIPAYVLLCFGPVYLAYRQHRLATPWWLFSFFLTPPIAIILLLTTKPKAGDI